jgi:hypothetical protein
VAKQIWHPGFWVEKATGKARAQKNATWVKVVAVIAVLWIWGHFTTHPSAAPASTAHPSSSASAPAR